jgi:hypothetical protein
LSEASSERIREILAAPPRPPADPARFSSNTLFGEPGIYPDGPPMVPAPGPPVDRAAARRALADLGPGPGPEPGLGPGAGGDVAARLDEAALVERAPDAGVRAGLLALTGTIAEPLLDAFVAGAAAVERLAYGTTASPGRVVGPPATATPQPGAATTERPTERVVNDRYAAENPALLVLSLTHDLLWRGAGASQCEEATLHALGAMAHVQLLSRCPELASAGTELARRQNSLAITLLNSRRPGSADIALIAPDGPGTIPGGAPSMQTRDFWSIPFVSGGPHDGDAPPLLASVLRRVLDPDATLPDALRYDDALGALLSERLGRAWLSLDAQWRAAAALGLVEPPVG